MTVHVSTPYKGECDFCCKREIKWRYKVKTFEEQTPEMKDAPVEVVNEAGEVLERGQGIVWESTGDWAACNDCYTVIQQATKPNGGGLKLMMDKILPKLWARTRGGKTPPTIVISAVTQAWTMFYMNRMDDTPERVYDAEQEIRRAQ